MPPDPLMCFRPSALQNLTYNIFITLASLTLQCIDNDSAVWAHCCVYHDYDSAVWAHCCVWIMTQRFEHIAVYGLWLSGLSTLLCIDYDSAVWAHCCVYHDYDSAVWAWCCVYHDYDSAVWAHCCVYHDYDSAVWAHCCVYHDYDSAVWSRCCVWIMTQRFEHIAVYRLWLSSLSTLLCISWLWLSGLSTLLCMDYDSAVWAHCCV